MSDPEGHILSPQENAYERRITIARHDYNTCFSDTQEQLAERFGVNQSVISKDRKHTDYTTELESLKGNKIRSLRVQAWNVIEAGLNAEDTKVAMWLLDKTETFTAEDENKDELLKRRIGMLAGDD